MTKLLSLAILPVLFILYFVYKKDKVEKEPLGLILLLLFLGAVSCAPAAFLEGVGDNVLLSFLNYNDMEYIILENFLVIAVAEELCKYLFMRIATWRNKNFNFFFDGIVYAVTVSLGFALLENILYVMDGGISVALTRAALSIPGHACFGVCMGIYYSEARYRKNYNMNAESRSYTFLALVLPMLMHGFYDFALSTNSILMMIAFFLFVGVTDFMCIRKILKYSKNDKYIMKVDPQYLNLATGNGTDNATDEVTEEV